MTIGTRANAQEQRVERLCQKTGCSPQQAEEALSQGKGSLLSAVLYLEETGSLPVAPGGTFSTKDFSRSPPEPVEPWESELHSEERKTLFSWLKEELFFNQLGLWYKEQFLFGIPVIFLLLLFPLSYGSLFPLLLLPLLFGLHYQFSAEGSFLAEFNPIMKRVTRTVSHLRHRLWRK